MHSSFLEHYFQKQWRDLLFRTPNLSNYVSGAILYEETLYQDAADGTAFTDLLKAKDIVPGIKVDTGKLLISWSWCLATHLTFICFC